MCVISSLATASALTAVGLSSAASSAAVVAGTTVAANAAIGAGISAGIGAATGARGRQLGMAAGIGALSGGLASGLGMAATGVSTLDAAGSTASGITPGFGSTAGVYTSGGGLVGNPTATAIAADGASASASPLAETGAATIEGADGASGGLPLSNADKAALVEKGVGALGQVAQAGVSGYGQIEQAKDARKSLDDQAKFEMIRAQQALDRAAVEKMDNARRTRQLVGKGKVAAAANGVMLETRAESLASMWEQDAHAELAYDNAKIDYNAQLEAWGYRENARRLRREGRLGVKTARRGAVTGTLGAAGIGLGNVALSGFTIGVKNGWFAGAGAGPGTGGAGLGGVDWDEPGYFGRTANRNIA